MKEKSLPLISEKMFLKGTAVVINDNDCITVDIKAVLQSPLPEHMVLRAYFVYKNLDTINIGVMKTIYLDSAIKKTIPSPSTFPDAICIALKDTLEDSSECVASAFLGDAFDTYQAFSKDNDKSQKHCALSSARLILDKIKNASATHDQGVSKSNCISQIISALSDKTPTGDELFQFKKVYKISEFSPIVNLSALKYAMFDGLCAYSFFNTGYYLTAFEDCRLLMAFEEYDGKNPFFHIEEFSNKFTLHEKVYHSVIIELNDDGQYFISQ